MGLATRGSSGSRTRRPSSRHWNSLSRRQRAKRSGSWVRGARTPEYNARGQVAAFIISSVLSAETLLHALNHYLDDDISVHRAAEADLGFDPRRDAMSRRYHYSILNSPTRSPLLRGHTCHVRGNLDVSMMDRAAGHLVGSHDFASFSRALTGTWRLYYPPDHGGLHLKARPDGDTGNGGQRVPYSPGAAHCRCAGTGGD